MKTLAIDTSTKTQTLALTDGSAVISRRLSVVRTNHSVSLLTNIDDMLAQAEWAPGELELIAVGLGPGTFTGLRVGLATAKAIARSAGAEIVGVSSLAATARPVSSLFDGVIFAACDARRGELYVASFRARDGELEELADASAITPAEVRRQVDETAGPVCLVGNGVRAFDELNRWDRPDVRVLPQPWDAPSSVSIAWLAASKLAASGGDDLAKLEPDYVRASDAEINLGRRSS